MKGKKGKERKGKEEGRMKGKVRRDDDDDVRLHHSSITL